MIPGVITFKDKTAEVHIYRTKYALPNYTAEKLSESRTGAYDLPKFEACESAAAFATYAKQGKGDVKILPSGDWKDVTPPEARFRYLVTVNLDILNVEVFAIHWDEGTDKWYEKCLFSGTPEQFTAWALKERDAI